MTLDQQILMKLKNLGDPELNRVARAFARIRFGERFKWIDGLGYNDEGKPIGWRPDVFSMMAEDRLDRIETTTTKNLRGIWQNDGANGHFQKILSKIAASKVGGGLVYVAGHPGVRFTRDILQKMADAAVDAGLSRDLVRVIGSDALADALCQPEMAGVRIGLLGVGEPKRFSLVRREFFPDRGRLTRAGMANPFIPTTEDLDAGTVYFPDLGQLVEQRLHDERVALVRGLGASGKSVLAWVVGLRWQSCGPSYYLSLRNATDGGDVAVQDYIEELILFSADNALFIVDDCHLNEEAARRIYLAWQALEGPHPALLLVGREMRSRRGSPIYEIDLEPLLLLARQQEVRGVFTRLIARYLRENQDSRAVPDPEEALNLWVETFGGALANPNTTTDLIAFSSAVQHRRRELLKQDWTLSERDAAEEMREHYLGQLSAGERRNLLMLSVVQRFEIQLADSLLPDRSSGLSRCINRLGIVFCRKLSSAGALTLYQLAHSALGRLILTASGQPSDDMKVFETLATRSTGFGLRAYRALRTAGEAELADVVRRATLTSPPVNEQISLAHWKSLIRLAEEFSHEPDASSFFNYLSSPEVISELVSYASTISPSDLADFLRTLTETSTDSRTREFGNTIVKQLCEREHAIAWAQRALNLPPDQVDGFLNYAAWREQFDPLVSSLAKYCDTDTVYAEVLAEKAYGILTEAVVNWELGSYRFALHLVRRVLSVFGTTTVPVILEVVEDARLYEVSFLEAAAN